MELQPEELVKVMINLNVYKEARDADIVYMRADLHMTYKDIGAKYGLSPQRAQQIYMGYLASKEDQEKP